MKLSDLHINVKTVAALVVFVITTTVLIETRYFKKAEAEQKEILVAGSLNDIRVEQTDYAIQQQKRILKKYNRIEKVRDLSEEEMVERDYIEEDVEALIQRRKDLKN